MGMQLIGEFTRLVEAAGNVDDLRKAMSEISVALGFQYFALAHHVDLANASNASIRLHNYPTRWADFYEANALGVSDPVHRASHVTSYGFRWARIPFMIPLTAGDHQILAMGREQGIGDGFTVPANVPGESRGSCSFANDFGRPVPDATLPLAQLAGAIAFDAARRLWSTRRLRLSEPAPVLTDCQRLCVKWATRGKSDWEIGRILGVSQDTATCHIKQARGRYGVQKRTLLAVRTLFDGTLSFDDILKN